MNRFFINPEDIDEGNGTAEIRGEPVKHITRVLRLNVKEKLIIADGRGKSYLGEITGLAKESVTVSIIEPLEKKSEPDLEVVLAQAVTRGEKMDFIVQKCTELGVKKILPFTAERFVVKISLGKARDKAERWRKIAKGAAEQSHRDRIPEIGAPVKLESILDEVRETDLALLLWERENNRGLKETLREHPGAKRVVLLVGPEGGFTEEEAEQAVSRGAISVSLGPRILRAETAAAAAVAVVLYELGDLGGLNG